jgi:SNF2 family DNA or RNA helicase
MSLITKMRELLYSARDWVPERYQKKGVKFMLENAAAAILLDPGLGKTSITLAAIKILIDQGLVDRVMIIAPLRVCFLVWPLEIEKWKDFNHLKWCVLHGRDKEEWLESDAQIFLINPEGLEWLLTKEKTKKRTVVVDGDSMEVVETMHIPDYTRFKIMNPQMLVVDESTKFKNSTSARSQYLKPFLRFFRRRYILTGTFAPNGLMDLFGQMLIVDLGKSLGQYITHYRKKFFDSTGFGGYDYRIKPSGEKEIYRAIKPYALRMDAEDYIKLPEMKDNPIVVALSKKGRKAYDEMEEEMCTTIDLTRVSAVSAGTASMKCRQLAGGAVYTEGGKSGKSRSYIITDERKMDALEDLVEQRQGKPILVMYEFGHELDRMLKKFGKDTPFIGGGVSPKRSDMINRAWNENLIPVLLAHQMSIGHGLNMQEGDCDAMCWYSLPWDLEGYLQTLRRLRRRGSKHGLIMNHMLFAEDTVDLVLLQSIRAKDKQQKVVHDAFKTYIRSKK